MSDDLLQRAAWALTLEAEAALAPVAATRARILQRIDSPSRRRGRRPALLLGTLLFLSGSLALATVGRPAAVRVWRAVIQQLAPRARVSTGPAPDQVATRPPPVRPRIQRLSAPAPAPAAVPLVASDAARSIGPSIATTPLALFHRAHQLHFRARDTTAALAAWDRYLQADPTGPLVLEARYNRALCLVRLGRAAEARAALRPFADGTVAHYRRAEASALIQALAGAGR